MEQRRQEVMKIKETKMTKKLMSQIKQLTLKEKQNLSDYLADEIGVKPTIGTKMLRDDIETKVTALIESETGEFVSDETLLNQIDLKTFAETLIKEFDLEDIALGSVMEWQTVEDIAQHIEDILECAESDTHISSFEMEA